MILVILFKFCKKNCPYLWDDFIKRFLFHSGGLEKFTHKFYPYVKSMQKSEQIQNALKKQLIDLPFLTHGVSALVCKECKASFVTKIDGFNSHRLAPGRQYLEYYILNDPTYMWVPKSYGMVFEFNPISFSVKQHIPISQYIKE